MNKACEKFLKERQYVSIICRAENEKIESLTLNFIIAEIIIAIFTFLFMILAYLMYFILGENIS